MNTITNGLGGSRGGGGGGGDKITWLLVAAIITLTIVPILNNYSLLKLGSDNKALNEKTVNVVITNNKLLYDLLNQTSIDTHLLRHETNTTLQSIVEHEKNDKVEFKNVLDNINNNSKNIKDIAENLKLTKINFNRIYQNLNETHELINAVNNLTQIINKSKSP